MSCRTATALLGTLLLLTAGPVVAQQRPSASRSGGCVFSVDHVGGEGTQQVVGADTSYFAGGGVRLSCLGTSVRMESDSVAYYFRRTGILVNFIGNVHYRDSLITMDADRGTYYKNGEKWEARGNVVTRNLENGSTLTGPSLDYLRVMPGVRDTAEIYSIGRPTIKSVTTDSAGNRGEPYVIVGDRIRIRGNDRTWAGGKVTVDRSDFAALGDSLYLDSGAGEFGVLVGKPQMRGLGKDSFNLTGERIELTLDKREITYVKALGNGHAVSTQVDLVADTIGLDLDARSLSQTLAWGDSIKPRALASEYEIRGDSVAFDTPGQQLRQVRSFQHAWVGGKTDSLTRERDWMAGDTVVASFTPWDSAGIPRTRLDRLEASGAARSYYRVAESRVPGGLPSINYSRGERIGIQMKPAGLKGVERVDIHGQVDGVYLEPTPVVAPADSTAPQPARRRSR
jgi:hypothetical protein